MTTTGSNPGELLDEDGTHSVACECGQCIEPAAWCSDCAGIGRVREGGLSVICHECWTVNALCEWCTHAARDHNADDLYCQAESGCGCDIYKRRNAALAVPR